jgi:hypothetical protein
MSSGGAAYAAPAEASGGLVIGAIICAIVALIFLPPVFGGVAIWLGSKVRKTNEGLGTGLMVFSGVCLVVGMVIGALVFVA